MVGLAFSSPVFPLLSWATMRRQTQGRGAQTVLDPLHKQLGIFVNAKVPKQI